MTVGGKNIAVRAIAGVRVSIWSVIVAAVFALMIGMPSGASANTVKVHALGSTGFTPVSGATVKITDANGNEVASGTTASPSAGKTARFEADLPTGTYTIETSLGGESGTETFTVTNGENRSVVEMKAGGNQNPPGSGTAATAAGTDASGATNLGAAPTAISGMPFVNNSSSTSWNASVFTGASGTFIPGVDMLAGFSGGNPTGVNAVSTDGNNVGTHVGGNLRYKMPTPGIGNLGLGAESMYYNFRGESIWGRSVTKTDRIDSTVEVPGFGILNNFLTNSIDNLEARTEYDKMEFAAALGFVYGLGPLEAYSLGNLLWGSVGNLGGTNRGRGNQVKFITEAELLYQRTERNDDVDFSSPGNSNKYRNETETNKVGVRVGGRLSVPVTRGVRFKIGGTVGVSRASHELESSLDRTGTLAHASDEKTKIGYDFGLNTSLTAKVGPGRLSAYFNYLFESTTPTVHFQASSNDDHRLDFESAQQVTTGLKYIIPTSLFASDAKLKTDIVRIGALPSGLPVYSYKYIGYPETHVGVMAQEALLMYPDAVTEINGFLAVDYAKIK